jgi:hypothetical protein
MRSRRGCSSPAQRKHASQIWEHRRKGDRAAVAEAISANFLCSKVPTPSLRSRSSVSPLPRSPAEPRGGRAFAGGGAGGGNSLLLSRICDSRAGWGLASPGAPPLTAEQSAWTVSIPPARQGLISNPRHTLSAVACSLAHIFTGSFAQA